MARQICSRFNTDEYKQLIISTSTANAEFYQHNKLFILAFDIKYKLSAILLKVHRNFRHSINQLNPSDELVNAILGKFWYSQNHNTCHLNNLQYAMYPAVPNSMGMISRLEPRQIHLIFSWTYISKGNNA